MTISMDTNEGCIELQCISMDAIMEAKVMQTVYLLIMPNQQLLCLKVKLESRAKVK